MPQGSGPSYVATRTVPYLHRVLAPVPPHIGPLFGHSHSCPARYSPSYVFLAAVIVILLLLLLFCLCRYCYLCCCRCRCHRPSAGIVRQDIAWFDKEDNSTGALTARLATEATLVKNITGQNLGRQAKATRIGVRVG